MKPVENLTLEEIDHRIARTAVEAAIEIGYYLKQIRDRKLYEQAGCKDVYEYAKKHYGYDKSVASRHMSRNDRFSVGGNSPELAEEYLSYGKNQLQEMVSMTPEQLEQATPDMTVREMRELKKKPEKAQVKPENPDQKAVATSQQTLSEELQPVLSAYGLPKIEYPAGSLISEEGCGVYGEIGYSCFSCHMHGCRIREKECYCVEAPMGKPFSCKTLLLMEQEPVRQKVGNHSCQFLDHGLADHRLGDGSAVPCCKRCDTPCMYQCDRATAMRQKEKEEEGPEERIIDGDCREVDAPPEDDRYEETSDRTDMKPAQQMLEKETQTLRLVLKAFDENDEYARKQKILVAALEGYIRDLDIQQDQKDHVQPELPVLRNNDQRKAWLRNYKDWGLWYKDDHIGAEYYKYDFANGARLIAEVYREPETKYVPAYESCHLHLVGGPKPSRKGSIDKWTRHAKYSRYPNSDTELVEFLKEAQRNE